MAELNFTLMPKWMPEALEIMALVETWAQAYEVPRDAILRQIPIAYAWSQSNKKKAPRKQVTRFLHTWMRHAKLWGNLAVKAKETPKLAPQEPSYEMTVEEMREIRRRNMPQFRGDPQKYPGAIETEAV